MCNTLIYSDLDGTLLDHDNYQYSAASSTLLQLKAANIPVILNTSKTFAELTEILAELSLTSPFIVENGAAIYIPVTTFDKQPEGTHRVDNYWVKSFSLPKQHWLNLLAEHGKAYSQFFQSFSTLSDVELAELTGLSLAAASRAKQRQFGEPIHWFGSVEDKLDFIETLTKAGANLVSGGRFLHIGDDCNKGQALVWLTAQYRHQFPNTPFTTIALGDGENDSAMLEVADHAVQILSPAHQFPRLNRQDNVIQTLHCGPKGWAIAIQSLLAKQLSSTSTHSGVNHG
jgi:mannosyl-3-phosphoglycerate phosphatase